MHSTKNILRLPKAELDQVKNSADQLDDIMHLKAQLDAALEEIDTLRRRSEGLNRNVVLPRNKFTARLANVLGPDAKVKGTFARIHVQNFHAVHEEYGDEAAEELCNGVGAWLAGHIRGTDIIGRVGTCTFAIFFGFGARSSIENKLTRLLRRIEHAPLHWKDKVLNAQLSATYENVDDRAVTHAPRTDTKNAIAG